MANTRNIIYPLGVKRKRYSLMTEEDWMSSGGRLGVYRRKDIVYFAGD